jgi:AcrR family transcriptional regulator
MEQRSAYQGGNLDRLPKDEGVNAITGVAPERRVRADAMRNSEKVLKAAMSVFATSGVDASVREIAAKAGVGMGTLYRHFPQRSDLIAAVVRSEVDACADAAISLAEDHDPGEALTLWMHRYVDFIVAKRGLAAALSSGSPAVDSLPAYFEMRLRPALQTLLDAAAAAGEVRGDIDPYDLLMAVARLSTAAQGVDMHGRQMVSILVDGLRYGASPKAK